jgi:hypothetical protein
MKKVIIGFVSVAFGVLLSVGVFAQPPRPPVGTGLNGNQSPGNPIGSPIEPGTGILLMLAAAYGFKKVQVAKRSQD